MTSGTTTRSSSRASLVSLARVVVAVSIIGGSVTSSLPAGAAPAPSGPSIALDHNEVELGDAIIVSLFDFSSQQATISVCGNLAKRGSTDCNMPSSQSERIRADQGVTLTQLFVQPPPVPCPCIVRAAGTNGEFAVAAIEILDHPVGAVVTPSDGPLVEVAIAAEPTDVGFDDRVKTSLAGSTRFDVTVTVRNISTGTLTNVAVRARLDHRFGDDVTPLQFDRPGPIGPGQTWTQTVVGEVPAPVLGGLRWTVVASGAGPTIEATQVGNARPTLLYVLVGLLAIDLMALSVRFLIARRRRARRRAADHAGGTATADLAVA